MAALAKVVLYIVAVLALFSGLGAVILGKSAIHEILAAVDFLTFAVSLGLGALLGVQEKRDERALAAVPAEPPAIAVRKGA